MNRILSLALVTAVLASCDRTASPSSSVLKVTATIQYPDNRRPWLKKQPFNRAGLGTVIEGKRLLVTADMVAHSTFIALESPQNAPRGTATVEAIDQECNLAVLRPTDPKCLEGTVPLKLEKALPAGTTLQVMQLEGNGEAALSPATISAVTVTPYPSETAAYLVYRGFSTIPQRAGSFVIPALHDGKLAGLVMRYDSRTQAGEVIPSPLIARFLKESSKPGFSGLARAGLAWQEARGQVFRSWLGVGTNNDGVYISYVEPSGAATRAGLQEGDLLLTINGKTIDGEGNYNDPILGRITFNNLAGVESAPGDGMEIGYFRHTGEGTGTFGTATLTLSGRNPALETIPPIQDSGHVPYVFLGGLLFQELTRPYLREWGGNWRSEAPQRLAALDSFQEELPPDRGRIVILSAVLPSEQTLGYQESANKVVESINGRRIKSLSDVTDAAAHPSDGFHRIELEGSGGTIYLDASTLAKEQERLLRQYGIPSGKSP